MSFDANKLHRELIRGIIHLSRTKEFYGHIVQQFEKVYVSGDHPVDTAAVGRMPGERFIKLYLNTDFFGQMYNSFQPAKAWEYVLGVLEHEIVHCIFGHLFLKFEDKIVQQCCLS